MSRMKARPGRTAVRVGLLLATAGCSFAPTAARDASSQPGHGQIVDDSPGDFTGTLGSGTVVAARGAIEMTASLGGGLHARACDQNLINNDPTLTFGALEAKCTTLLGSGYAQTPRDYGTDRPRGLGLKASDRFTILYDGEIFLPAGSGTVSFDVDDSVLAQIDDGTGSGFAGSAAVGTLTKVIVPVAPTADGFYPMRVAWSEQDGGAHLLITQTPLPPGATEPILRAAVTAAPGVTVSQASFDWTSPLGVMSVPAVDAQLHRVSPPFDVKDNPPVDYVLRYVGQVLIDTAGPYTFAVATDGNPSSFERLWLDGTPVTEAPQLLPFTSAAATVPMLTAGWHDLVVDAQASQKTPHDVTFSVTLAAGSGAAVAIPSDHLRPVVTSGETLAVGNANALALTGAQPVLDRLLLPAAAGFAIDAYDAVAIYNDKVTGSDWTVALQEDGSSNSKLADLPAPTAAAGFLVYAQGLVSGLRGEGGNQPLAFAFTHTGSAAIDGGAKVNFVTVIATGHGLLPPPFPVLATYLSQVHATPDATQIVGVTLAGDLHGQRVTVALAVGDDAASLGEFRTVAADTALALPAGKVLAYKLVLAGDGWHAPAVDRVQIDYLTAPATIAP